MDWTKERLTDGPAKDLCSPYKHENLLAHSADISKTEIDLDHFYSSTYDKKPTSHLQNWQG
jgi:hypothetical protein